MKNPYFKFILAVLLIALPLSLFAAGGTLKGKVTEFGTSEILPGANVMIKGTKFGVASGMNGTFEIKNVPAGTQTLVVSFMGYQTQEKQISVQENASLTENFVLKAEVLIGKEVAILADRALERKTPVAFTNVQKVDMEARLGSQDIPMVMNVTPSVYATVQGGGSGDSRLTVRGFNQRNVAIMINGVPVNDMENGWVYWSNWDGLGDATSSIQMQRGLSAVNLATPSIGGTMNILTDPSAMQTGARYKQEFGNDGFLKTTLSASSGLIDGKYAVMGTVVRKTGDGLIDKTWTDAWAYYLGASWQVNKSNRLEAYAVGAPQRHGQNSYKQNIAAYSHEYAASLDDYDPAALTAFKEATTGRKYNENWNVIDESFKGEEFFDGKKIQRYAPGYMNERENYYHKPIVNLNWYSQLSSKTNLFTTLYYSGGVGGGSGTLGSVVYDRTSEPSQILDWNKTIEINKGIVDAKGVAKNARQSLGIMRNSVNNQWTVGLISKVNYKFSKALEGNIGLDWRTAEIEHYREIRNLLGGDYYVSKDSQFFPAAGEKLGLGDKVGYDFTNTVNWLGAFAQAEYSVEKFTAYGMAGYSTVSYSYESFFKKGPDGSTLKLDANNIGGYQVKGGAKYNVIKNFDIFGNVGYVNKVPIFDNVISDDKGTKAEDPKNEKFTSLEFGVNYYSKFVAAKVNYYYTLWNDRTKSQWTTLADGTEDLVFITGMDQLHTGIELEAAVKPIDMVRLDVGASFGNWTYQNDVSGFYLNYDNPAEPQKNYNFYIKDLKVGDAPQTQLALGASVFPIKGLYLQGLYRYYMNNYADFDPFSRTNAADRAEGWKAPDYGVVDFHASYKLPVTLGPVGLSIFAHVFNALDEIYVQDAVDNSAYNSYKVNKLIANPHKADAAEVYLGLPRTFNVGLQLTY